MARASGGVGVVGEEYAVFVYRNGGESEIAICDFCDPTGKCYVSISGEVALYWFGGAW